MFALYIERLKIWLLFLQMSLVDQFTHPQTNRESHCYRITYRAMDRTLKDEEVNNYQNKLRTEAAKQLHITLR